MAQMCDYGTVIPLNSGQPSRSTRPGWPLMSVAVLCRVPLQLSHRPNRVHGLSAGGSTVSRLLAVRGTELGGFRASLEQLTQFSRSMCRQGLDEVLCLLSGEAFQVAVQQADEHGPQMPFE